MLGGLSGNVCGNLSLYPQIWGVSAKRWVYGGFPTSKVRIHEPLPMLAAQSRFSL
jgi:hypothetical protein